MNRRIREEKEELYDLFKRLDPTIEEIKEVFLTGDPNLQEMIMMDFDKDIKRLPIDDFLALYKKVNVWSREAQERFWEILKERLEEIQGRTLIELLVLFAQGVNAAGEEMWQILATRDRMGREKLSEKQLVAVITEVGEEEAWRILSKRGIPKRETLENILLGKNTSSRIKEEVCEIFLQKELFTTEELMKIVLEYKFPKGFPRFWRQNLYNRERIQEKVKSQLLKRKLTLKQCSEILTNKKITDGEFLGIILSILVSKDPKLDVLLELEREGNEIIRKDCLKVILKRKPTLQMETWKRWLRYWDSLRREIFESFIAQNPQKEEILEIILDIPALKDEEALKKILPPDFKEFVISEIKNL